MKPLFRQLTDPPGKLCIGWGDDMTNEELEKLKIPRELSPHGYARLVWTEACEASGQSDPAAIEWGWQLSHARRLLDAPRSRSAEEESRVRAIGGSK